MIKNKSGDSNDVNNYRPIALVTIASKFFEMIVLDVIEPFIVTCDNQFGFKKKHSTEHLHKFLLTSCIPHFTYTL